MGILYRGTSFGTRFAVVDTKDIVEQMINRKNIDEELRKNKFFVNTISRIVGFAVILSTTLKSFKSFSIIINSDYIFKSIVLTMHSNSEIKGYIALNENPKELSTAFMKVIVDMGLREPYTNITRLDYNNLLNDLMEYFNTSEQIATLISMGGKP